MKLTLGLRCIIMAIGLPLLASGCGSDNDSSDSLRTATFRDQEIAIVSEPDLEESSDALEGTGTVKFVSPLAEESQAGAHVGLTFELLADDAALTLVTFASPKLEDGISVKWTKTKTTVSVDGETKDITSKLPDIDWSKPVSFRVDVHNDEDPAHMIMWRQSLSDAVDESNEFYNSAETDGGDFQVPGQGDGVIGGIILKDVRVSNLVVSEPQEEDDH